LQLFARFQIAAVEATKGLRPPEARARMAEMFPVDYSADDA
jgi:hypothetical protein